MELGGLVFAVIILTILTIVIFKKDPVAAKKKLKIIKVLNKTPGGFHSWVLAETESGEIIKIRKPNNKINL